MNTDDLINALVRDAGPAPRAMMAKRLAPVMVCGFLISAALATGALGVAPVARAMSVALWMKVFYALCMAASAAWLAGRLARPGTDAGRATAAVALVVIAMVAVGMTAMLLTNAPSERHALTFGISWWFCPWAILALSLPTLGGALWAMKGMAPTRPGVAGFVAGVLAGAVGALGYAFACIETSTTFVAIWYTVGILLAGLAGAAFGRRMLRW